jgi:hypothetical protein
VTGGASYRDVPARVGVSGFAETGRVRSAKNNARTTDVRGRPGATGSRGARKNVGEVIGASSDEILLETTAPIAVLALKPFS